MTASGPSFFALSYHNEKSDLDLFDHAERIDLPCIRTTDDELIHLERLGIRDGLYLREYLLKQGIILIYDHIRMEEKELVKGVKLNAVFCMHEAAEIIVHLSELLYLFNMDKCKCPLAFELLCPDLKRLDRSQIPADIFKRLIEILLGDLKKDPEQYVLGVLERYKRQTTFFRDSLDLPPEILHLVVYIDSGPNKHKLIPL